MKKIQCDQAPAAIGPYSQAYMANGFLFISGQIPVEPATGEIPADITSQTEQSCKNVQAIVESAGSSMEKVIKTTCFLADMSYFNDFNKVYERYFVSKPARSCVAVKGLPKNVLCEIETIVEL